MCVDMGQADRSLYQRPERLQHKMCWTIALKKAAKALGFDHYIEVPDDQVEALKASARKIQIDGVST